MRIDYGIFVFIDKEILIYSDMSNTLRPLDVAIKEIGKDSATLIELDAIIKFLTKNLEKANTKLFSKLVCLKARRNKRQIKLLKTYPFNSGRFNDNFLKYKLKAESKEFTIKLYNWLFFIESNRNLSDDDILDKANVNENDILCDLNKTRCVLTDLNKKFLSSLEN